MRKSIVLLMAVLVLFVSACGTGGVTSDHDVTNSSSVDSQPDSSDVSNDSSDVSDDSSDVSDDSSDTSNESSDVSDDSSDVSDDSSDTSNESSDVSNGSSNESDDSEDTTKPEEIIPSGNTSQLMLPMKGGADEQADDMRAAVQNAPDTLKPEAGGKVYYISNKGVYGSDGLSPEKAVPIDSPVFRQARAGDVILFNRGEIFRPGYTITMMDGVKYGAYGTGNKPAIYGSNQNYAQDGYWTPTQKKYVWKCEQSDFFGAHSIGTIVFNHGEDVGHLKTGLNTMNANGDFYHNYGTGTVYLYCDKGKPDVVYKSIEMGIVGAGMGMASNTVVENLCFKYTRLFGLRNYGGVVKNVVIRGCEFGWIGGGYLNETNKNRAGNAVEFWDGCEDILIENSWVYQIFDTGLTFQGNPETNVYNNIVFRDNLIEYCAMAIEIWNTEGGVIDNVKLEGNIFRFSGYGWGQRENDRWNPYMSAHLQYANNDKYTTLNISIENNIFDISRFQMVQWTWHEGAFLSGYVHKNNTYYQKETYDDLVVIYGATNGRHSATDQASFEAAVAAIDTDPKLVSWIN